VELGGKRIAGKGNDGKGVIKSIACVQKLNTFRDERTPPEVCFPPYIAVGDLNIAVLLLSGGSLLLRAMERPPYEIPS